MKRLFISAIISFATILTGYASDYNVEQANQIKVEGIAIAHNGRIWMSTHRQMSGGTEGLVVSYSDDSGVTWKDAKSVDGADGGVLWIAPNGGLLVFYSLDGYIYSSACPNASDASPVWMPQVFVGEGLATGTPVVCKDRRWVLPAQKADVGPMVYKSATMGMSWEALDGPRDIPEYVKAHGNNPHLDL